MQGVTMIELMVVILIIAALAAMGIPRYMKTVTQNILRDMRNQLITLHAANEMHRAKTGGYIPLPSTCVLSGINTAFKLNIIQSHPDIQYCYNPTPNTVITDYSATATLATGGQTFTINVTQNPISQTNPSCAEAPDWDNCPW